MPARSTQSKKKPDAFVEFLNSIFEGAGNRFLKAQEAFGEGSPEDRRRKAIETVMSFVGPGAIKSIRGLPQLGLRLGGQAISRPLGQAADDLGQFTDTIKQLVKQARREKGKANINSPVSLGTGLKRNIGGRRPPDTELEALALRKQQAQKIAKARKLARKKEFKRRTDMFEVQQGIKDFDPVTGKPRRIK